MRALILFVAACAVGGDDVGVAQAGVASRCSVGHPPPALHLSTFYTKYCDADGVPVVAAGVVADLAVQQGAALAAAMLRPMPDVRDVLVTFGVRFGIIGEHQVGTDMPEYGAWATGRAYGGSLDQPLATSPEENALCYEVDGNRGESLVVHEMGHTIMNGLALARPAQFARIRPAYDAAIAAGKYKGLYAGTNVDEYWAEGVQAYLGAHATYDPADIDDRATLAHYDPALYAILDELLADVRLPALCPTPVLDLHRAYRIASLAYPGRSLDVTEMKPSGNYTGQRWHLHAAPNATFSLTNEYTGDARVLDDQIEMAAVAATSRQRWRLSFHDAGVFRVTNASRAGRSLDAEPDEGPVELDTTGDWSNQLWTITPE